jgi:hypothetical protein
LLLGQMEADFQGIVSGTLEYLHLLNDEMALR